MYLPVTMHNGLQNGKPTKEREKMPIKKQAAGFKTAILATLIALTLVPWVAHGGETHFRIEKDAAGLIRPFKAMAVPLSEFIREYARLSATPVAWDREVTGTVTLYLRHPLKLEELTELFHRVLAENAYAAVDAPAGNGWVVVPARCPRPLASCV